MKSYSGLFSENWAQIKNPDDIVGWTSMLNVVLNTAIILFPLTVMSPMEKHSSEAVSINKKDENPS